MSPRRVRGHSLVEVPDRRMPAFECGQGRVFGQLDPSARREETPIIQEFELRSVARSGSSMACFPVHPMKRVSPDGRHAIG